ncbi:SLBB domain-containing protein [Flectobacillus sp. DC10W]|jgi:protein involved in polysaccharide export with SLBB domain|uniref:SLBB domain-containing protein n=1 Tax=Flectobacillus longus TaxID=2984207 RepID=A0ABT6YKA4_9BACT|nr:SLBB domain-containing protein [Flectobacillus longus]MDI9864022.1 SLBB domain-containing protein [Flectobacillus longus]
MLQHKNTSNLVLKAIKFRHSFMSAVNLRSISLLLVALWSLNSFAQIPGIPTNISLPTSIGRPTTATATGTKNSGSRKVTEIAAEKNEVDSLRKKKELALNEADSNTVNLRKKIFGYSIFNNSKITFDSYARMATPKNYILGPDDEIIIDINGYSESHLTLPISPDGNIKVDRVGNIFVSGLTIEEAKKRIISRLSQIYVGLKASGGVPANTTATISLGNIRTIRVTVIGEVIAPGTYAVSSLAKVFNVLYQAGGPNENGTFREIKVIRGKKLVARVDLYDLLTTGNLRQDIALQDQDIIQVTPYKARIEIAGKVKKPAMFEILPNENLDMIINDYAGGFLPEAYRGVLKVTRYTDKERKLVDLSGDLLSSFFPKSGDFVAVDQILLDRYENAINLKGAVFRPGRYSLSDNSSLVKLIKRADGFKEDAFLDRILIVRLKSDLTKENIAINYKEILSGVSPDFPLKREDEITVYSSLDMMENYTVRIQGEIKLTSMEGFAEKTPTGSTALGILPNGSGETPSIGTYPYVKNMTVEDLVVKAGGLKESAATGRIEVIRRKKNIGQDDPSKITPTIGEKFQFSINPDLSMSPSASKFILEPFDEVFVRSSPNYERQQFVSIDGQVIFPGVYALERKDEKLLDVIKRAGGLNAQAYPAGATLIRRVKLTDQEVERKARQIQDLSDNNTETSVKVEPIKQVYEESIGIDLVDVLENENSKSNMLLQDGDILRIPKEPQTVRMQGEVLYPTSTRFIEGASFKHYISESGGFTSLSSRKRSYVIYANGSVDRTRKLLGLVNIYPKINPGSEIVVPRINQKQMASQQVLGIISTITASLTGIGTIIALMRAIQ